MTGIVRTKTVILKVLRYLAPCTSAAIFNTAAAPLLLLNAAVVQLPPQFGTTDQRQSLT